MQEYKVQVKGSCSDEYVYLACETARKAVDLEPDDIKLVVLVVDRVINFILAKPEAK